MRWLPSTRDWIAGMSIYASGDTVAAWILDEFTWVRLSGMMIVGGLVYAIEVPAYFRFLDRRFPLPDAASPEPATPGVAWKRTLLALAYFNPLWIARHLLFLQIIQQAWDQITWGLLRTGLYSFLAALPVAFLANLCIQTRIPLAWRFAASAIFSATMAIHYAMSSTWF